MKRDCTILGDPPGPFSITYNSRRPLRVCLLGLGGGGFHLEILKLVQHTERPLELILIFAGPAGGIINWGTEDVIRSSYVVRSPSLTGDSTAARVARFAGNLWLALRILLAERPDLILAVGTAQAVPFAFSGKLVGTPLWFVESCTRVHAPSRTGRIIAKLRLSERIYYFWPELARHFKRGICTQEVTR
jgi:UDP-N-acetylglucosamine:LPS N-acetylglucosamine transferase